MNVQTTIMGVEVTLQKSTDRDPRGRRLGSIPIITKDGNKHMVRVYGKFEKPFTPTDRQEFEKSIRAFCARPDVVRTLFGIEEEVIPVRFNPSELLLMAGWRNRPGVSVITTA